MFVSFLWISPAADRVALHPGIFAEPLKDGFIIYKNTGECPAPWRGASLIFEEVED
jgi:hypothetical protein